MKYIFFTIMIFSVFSCKQPNSCTREFYIVNFQNNEKCFKLLVDFFNSQKIINNKEEQIVFSLNRYKDDVNIDIIPYIINDKKTQISMSNIRANFEMCKKISQNIILIFKEVMLKL